MKMLSSPTQIADLDVGAVERADGQRAVERQLHVAGAGRLHARGRDLLGEVGGGDDDLGEADVVVRQEHHLQQAAHGRVGVDDLGDVVGELDDQLGLRVARRRLAGEDLHPRRQVAGRVGADGVVERDGLQDVEQLALVFVDALDLHVEQRVGVDALVDLLGDGARRARTLLVAARRPRTAPERPDRRRSAARPFSAPSVVEHPLAERSSE